MSIFSVFFEIVQRDRTRKGAVLEQSLTDQVLVRRDGQIVEIEAMMRLANGSLREGRFKAVRHDKTVEDID